MVNRLGKITEIVKDQQVLMFVFPDISEDMGVSCLDKQRVLTADGRRRFANLNQAA